MSLRTAGEPNRQPWRPRHVTFELAVLRILLHLRGATDV